MFNCRWPHRESLNSTSSSSGLPLQVFLCQRALVFWLCLDSIFWKFLSFPPSQCLRHFWEWVSFPSGFGQVTPLTGIVFQNSCWWGCPLHLQSPFSCAHDPGQDAVSQAGQELLSSSQSWGSHPWVISPIKEHPCIGPICWLKMANYLPFQRVSFIARGKGRTRTWVFSLQLQEVELSYLVPASLGECPRNWYGTHQTPWL